VHPAGEPEGLFARSIAGAGRFPVHSKQKAMLMKKRLPALLPALALLPLLGSGQVVYTAETAFPGHVSRTYEIRENWELAGSRLPVVTSGTDVVWDLSGHTLEAPFLRTLYFEPAAATPFAGSFPNANIVAWEADIFGTTDYQYFTNSEFEMRLLGGIHIQNGEEQVITFCPDPFLVMDYPMTIGSGVQHVYNCPQGQGEVDNWVIMATGDVIFDGGMIEDLVLWRSIFTGPGYQDTSFFWTQPDNVLYPVVRYYPGVYLRVRKPVEETVLSVMPIGEQQLQFDVFPNPATASFSLRTTTQLAGATQVFLLDATGRRVRDLGILNGSPSLATYSVEGLAPGMYMVELRGAAMPAQRRPLVKE
jgi:hypothetical protein